jgi:hypothetical protein
VFYQDIVCSMNVDGTIKCVVNTTASDIRGGHVSIKMEMDWISSKSESLTSMGNLCVRYSSSN